MKRGVSPAVKLLVPPEIWASRLKGIPNVMKVKERGKLTTMAVWTIVVRSPFATPLFSADIGLIIELALGEMKRPLPIPEAIRPNVMAA